MVFVTTVGGTLKNVSTQQVVVLGGTAAASFTFFACLLSRNEKSAKAKASRRELEENLDSKRQATWSIIDRYVDLDPLVEERKNVAMRSVQPEFEDHVNLEHVFSSWMGWSPVPRSKCFNAVHTHFPGTNAGSTIYSRVQKLLTDMGFDINNTLYGQSICPDEINLEKGGLASRLTESWGPVFPLGGIGGSPYVGNSGFLTFSKHVPEGGNIFILYGPHMAVSETGEVGQYARAGQRVHSRACGVILRAYNQCLLVDSEFPDTRKLSIIDNMDMQQAWLRNNLEPYAEDISKAANPFAAVAIKSFEVVHQKLMDIIDLDFGAGKLVLLGGIQINLPRGYEDHFCPYVFEVRQAGQPPVSLLETAFGGEEMHAEVEAVNGHLEFTRRRSAHVGPVPLSTVEDCAEAEVEDDAHTRFFSWLGWSPSAGSACERSVNLHFKGGLPCSVLTARVKRKTAQHGMTPESTLYGESICPDEINHMPGTLSDRLKDFFGGVFPLGGIGAAPFVGKSGFGAFSEHVPLDGHIFILYGPHIAVSAEGEVGAMLRVGQAESSPACGALIAAYESCMSGEATKEHEDPLDLQQNWLKEQLKPYTARIQKAENPMVALAFFSYEIVRQKMLSIVNTTFGTGNLVLLGGIQLNMPAGFEDHFLPISFELHNQQTATPSDCMDAFCLQGLISNMESAVNGKTC